ncbi:MAG: radical SAM protein [Acidobacteriota bacterium]
MKAINKLKIRLLELRMIARGLLSTRHTILAHIVPMRRCNLACTYCNEYDDFSDPVPLEEMKKRIHRLASFGTSIITISGGEPTLHPQLDDIIRFVRQRGMIAGLITNGYFLTPERIEGLNRAGLQHLQISIDNVHPDDVSKKSLKVLESKLENLARHAEFFVNINSVIGGGIRNPEDAVRIAGRAVELGFSRTLGITHDRDGRLRPLTEKEMTIYERLRKRGKWSYARFTGFRESLARGRPNQWRCRAGARYLYICENGRVHYCSQQRGYPDIPLEEYTRDDCRREFFTPKSCAPYCTLACVHVVALFDNWRSPQRTEPYVVPQPILSGRAVRRSFAGGGGLTEEGKPQEIGS